MDIIECLSDVVGITEKECPCFPVPTIPDPDPEAVEGATIPAYDPALSHSGYYVDDSEDGLPLIFPASAKDCGDDDVFAILTKAKQDALTELITDFGSNLQEFTLPRHAEIISTLGEIERNVNVPLAVSMGNYVGILSKSRRVRGATHRIERIRIRASGALVNADLRILSDQDGFTADVITPITFSASSGVLTTIAITEPIVLPLTDQFGNAITYAIIYDRQGSGPYNYKLTCGCRTKPKPAWWKYTDAVGLSVAALTDIADYTGTPNRSYGLAIDSRFTCRSLDWLCRPHEEDWSAHPYFRVVAKVIQLMWINKTIGYLINSPKINRYTLVKNEYLLGKRNHNRKEIADRLAWLSQSIPADVVDCYQCKASNKISVGEILV